METKQDISVPVRAETYNRVIKALNVGNEGIRPEEWSIATFFWDEVLKEIDWETVSPMAIMLAEEALTLRMLATRLLLQIQSDALMVERRTGPDVLCPRVESWAKLQERFRNVMKELLERYGHRKGDAMPTSLAAMVQPLLEKGEGILNELRTVEISEETIEEYWEEFIDD